MNPFSVTGFSLFFIGLILFRGKAYKWIYENPKRKNLTKEDLSQLWQVSKYGILFIVVGLVIMLLGFSK